MARAGPRSGGGPRRVDRQALCAGGSRACQKRSFEPVAGGRRDRAAPDRRAIGARRLLDSGVESRWSGRGHWRGRCRPCPGARNEPRRGVRARRPLYTRQSLGPSSPAGEKGKFAGRRCVARLARARGNPERVLDLARPGDNPSRPFRHPRLSGRPARARSRGHSDTLAADRRPRSFSASRRPAPALAGRKPRGPRGHALDDRFRPGGGGRNGHQDPAQLQPVRCLATDLAAGRDWPPFERGFR